MSNLTIALAIGITALVTFLTRAISFIIFANGRKTPAFITYLGGKLPYAVMAMLVVYCYKGISFTSIAGFVPALIAGAVTVGSYVWRRNTLLSIIVGTALYMFLIQVVF